MLPHIRDVASEGYPKRLIFNPFLFWRRGQLLDDLKSLGYNVPEPARAPAALVMH